MLPPKPPLGRTQRLQRLFEALERSAQDSLLDFAEYLADRGPGDDETAASGEVPEPLSLERPQQETVIAALKRLSETYFMLDKSVLLHQSSALVGAHMTQGRASRDVIDEMEALFLAEYRKLSDSAS